MRQAKDSVFAAALPTLAKRLVKAVKASALLPANARPLTKYSYIAGGRD